MHLIDKIARYGFRSNMMPEVMQKAALATLKRAVTVDIQNVAEWYFEDASDPDFSKLSPMFVPPFDVTWFEYVDYWGPPTTNVGLLLLSKKEVQGFDEHPHGVLFVNVPEISQEVVAEAGGLRFIVGPNNELQSIQVNNSLEYLEDSTKQQEAGAQKARVAAPCAAAVSFFHCRNVKIGAWHPDEKRSVNFKRRTGQLLRSMKVIDIHLPRTVSRSKSEGSVSHELGKAHIVRGHFKRYNALFGSISGVWFWHPHVRGAGVPAIPEYSVHGPDEQHEPNCIVEKDGKDESTI